MKAERHPFLLDGKWVDEGERVEIRSPYDQTVVGETVRASRKQLEHAISASVRAFEATRKATSHERNRVLSAVAEGISRDREGFARTIAQEAGKPIKTARAEVDRAIFTFTVAADESLRNEASFCPWTCNRV